MPGALVVLGLEPGGPERHGSERRALPGVAVGDQLERRIDAAVAEEREHGLAVVRPPFPGEELLPVEVDGPRNVPLTGIAGVAGAPLVLLAGPDVDDRDRALVQAARQLVAGHAPTSASKARRLARNAPGRSSGGRWPDSGIVTSFAPAIPEAIAAASGGGVSSSFSPTRTSVGTSMVGRVGRESGRSRIASTHVTRSLGASPERDRPRLRHDLGLRGGRKELRLHLPPEADRAVLADQLDRPLPPGTPLVRLGACARVGENEAGDALGCLAPELEREVAAHRDPDRDDLAFDQAEDCGRPAGQRSPATLGRQGRGDDGDLSKLPPDLVPHARVERERMEQEHREAP